MNTTEPKFVFVVLHYLNIEDTLECIDSIQNNISYENFNIVIVDNASPNNSGKRLKEQFNRVENIKVILNEENMGFAKGNNVGFQFAKHELKADFIALINNDTILRQSEFISNIIQKFNELHFHILGPDILSTVNGEHQNPRKLTIQNKVVLKKLIQLYSVLLVLNYLLLDKIFERIKKSLFNKPIIESSKNQKPNWDEERQNVKLHGSAMVFSPLYIKAYEGLYPKTFMYSEEAILYFISQRDNLKIIYFPKIQILHKEDSSTEQAFNKNYKKRRFYYKNFIKSGKVFLELMENSR